MTRPNVIKDITKVAIGIDMTFHVTSEMIGEEIFCWCEV